MATYVFSCDADGGHLFEARSRGTEMCPGHLTPVKRDYRAENVGVQVAGLRAERERGGSSAVRDLFLPTAKELAGPGDPDGTKGIREWNETHDPKPGNKRPMRPVGEKAVF